jgi:lysophospholipase L1-like esterase
MNLKNTLKHFTIGIVLGMMSPGHVCGAPEGRAGEGVPEIFHKGARVLFQGDSITDGQRDKRGTYPGILLGQGYPYLIAANFCGHFPELNLTVLNRGISGNKVSDLATRWQNDTIALKPDVLSILIGVNDVWHNVAAKKEINFAEIEATYDKLLADTMTALPTVKIILCEPFILPGSANNKQWVEWDAATRKIQQLVARLGEKHKLPVVHFQKVFDEAVKRAPAEYWLFDGVHPAWAGHQLMADEWVRAVKEPRPR